MKSTAVQKLARVLKILVVIIFICNLVALVFVPGFVLLEDIADFVQLAPYENPLELPLRLVICFFMSWVWVWAVGTQEILLTAYFLGCGLCCAIILWQAKRVLGGFLKGETFTLANAGNMKRAAVCCFVISGASLVRIVLEVIACGNIVPLLTYHFLFVPVFLVAGLVCMVMSALFRQAAEMKAEHDLTI